MGEEAVQSILKRYFIVRISWVFGINGKNFIRTMLRLGESHAKLTVVDDQIGSPTYTRDLSVLLADMIQTERYGVYHATNEASARGLSSPRRSSVRLACPWRLRPCRLRPIRRVPCGPRTPA